MDEVLSDRDKITLRQAGLGIKCRKHMGVKGQDIRGRTRNIHSRFRTV